MAARRAKSPRPAKPLPPFLKDDAPPPPPPPPAHEVIGLFNTHSFVTDSIFPVLGGTFAAVALPFVVVQIAITTAWGGLYSRFPRFLPRVPAFGGALAADARDDWLLPWALWLAVVQPAAWLWLGRWAGPAPSWALLLGFNVVRIGPMYSNFAHVYTLCHMEAHRRYQLWGRRGPWGYAFNWWVGLYHGVLPGTFTASHLYNHHRFDNDVRDAYSTAGYPRDSIVSLLRYLVVWCFYATNLSTLYDFYKRRMPLWFCHTALGTAYYAGFVALAVHATSARWALWTIGYPLVEGNILLAVVNFTWHMFLEEGNEYVNSTTIEQGTEFIFSEEYHVVHHQAPGYHHTRYRAHYEKHRSKYDLVFEKCNLFELGFTAIFRNYERLRGFVKDPTPETIDILKRRLRCTWW